jgi:excisionase family DNA binding protein
VSRPVISDAAIALTGVEPSVPDGPHAPKPDALSPDPPRESLSSDREDAAPAVLTVDELAALLRVDRKTIYALVRRGELPGVRRLGRTVRIHRGTVLAWLAEGQGRVPRSRRFR